MDHVIDSVHHTIDKYTPNSDAFMYEVKCVFDTIESYKSKGTKLNNENQYFANAYRKRAEFIWLC